MDKTVEQRIEILEKKVPELEQKLVLQPCKYDKAFIQICDNVITTRLLSKIGLTLSIISLMCTAIYFSINTFRVLGK